MKLVDDWRSKVRKLWSVRVAGAAASITAVLVADPTATLTLLSMLPEGRPRIVVGVLVGLLVFVVPTVTVLLCQAPKEDKANG